MKTLPKPGSLVQDSPSQPNGRTGVVLDHLSGDGTVRVLWDAQHNPTEHTEDQLRLCASDLLPDDSFDPTEFQFFVYVLVIIDPDLSQVVTVAPTLESALTSLADACRYASRTPGARVRLLHVETPDIAREESLTDWITRNPAGLGRYWPALFDATL